MVVLPHRKYTVALVAVPRFTRLPPSVAVILVISVAEVVWTVRVGAGGTYPPPPQPPPPPPPPDDTGLTGDGEGLGEGLGEGDGSGLGDGLAIGDKLTFGVGEGDGETAFVAPGVALAAGETSGEVGAGVKRWIAVAP